MVSSGSNGQGGLDEQCIAVTDGIRGRGQGEGGGGGDVGTGGGLPCSQDAIWPRLEYK